jgi:hypothetical protein
MRPSPLAAKRRLAGWAARRRYAAVTMLAAAAFVAAGCTQGSQTTPGGPTPSATQQSGSGPFGGHTPTGVQLGHLLTHARLPSGWEPLTGAGPPEQDSGQSVHQAFGPTSTNDGCPIVNSSANVLYFTNWWSVSDGTLHVQGQAAAGSIDTPIMDLTIGAYQPAADVAKTLSLASHVAATCASFTDQSGEKVTVSSAPVSHLGSQGLYIRSSEQSSDGPIVAQVVLAQVGGYLVGADTDNATSSDISQATVESMVSWLAGLLQSS